MQTYIYRNGQQEGPFEVADLRAAYKNQQIGPSELVWDERSRTWLELSAYFSKPPPIPPARPILNPPVEYDLDPVLFDERGICVTKTRFLFGHETYALAAVTSVKPRVFPAERGGPAVLAIFSLTTLGIGVGLSVTGEQKVLGALIALGSALALTASVYWMIKVKPSYAVVITTTAGEKTVCISKDGFFIDAIIQALNRAISLRG
jgi:hypothetical protein